MAGGLLGGWAGASVAFAAVTIALPVPKHTRAIDAVAATHGGAAYAVWVYWIATGTVAAGILGAFAGGMIGASCATCRAPTPATAPPTADTPSAAPEDEVIARLRQCVTELERARDARQGSAS